MDEWMSPLRNKNRGYRKLIIWQDAIAYFDTMVTICRAFPYDMKRIAANQIAAADSIHRNIAEGYCRRSLKEYLQYLNIALGSAGESVSGLHAYHRTGHIAPQQFTEADHLAFKLENGLMKLIETLQQRLDTPGSWSDSFIIRESNALYHHLSGETEE